MNLTSEFGDARRAAKAEDKLHYKGRPCLYGHDGWRYVSNNVCIRCVGRTCDPGCLPPNDGRSRLGKTKAAKARSLARERGDLTYQGRPCKAGHDGIRLTRNAACPTCTVAGKRKWYNNLTPEQRQARADRQNLIRQELPPERRAAHRIANPEKALWKGARTRAQKSGREFNLSIDDIVVPALCPVLGIPLIVGVGRPGASDNSPTLDRIDNSKGYVRGNVEVMSWRANRLKNDASIEELELIITHMKRHRSLATPSLSLAA